MADAPVSPAAAAPRTAADHPAAEHAAGEHAAARLTYAEANPLAAALVSSLASDRGIRTLVIKGLSLEHHGLRPGHVSADVDVLVEPARFDDLLDAIADAGWRLRPTTTGDRLMTHHSVTFLNPAWPNDLDIHSTFPGMLAGPEASFEALWTHREQAVFGGFPCWIPDRPSAVVIWALHSLRGSQRQPRHASELRQLIPVVTAMPPDEAARLADRIVDLGAVRPLHVVPELAALTVGRTAPEVDGSWDAWVGKVAQAHEASPWLQVLRDARPVEWPRLLVTAVWPTRRDLLVLDPSAVDTTLGRVQARLRRIGRLVRRLFG